MSTNFNDAPTKDEPKEKTQDVHTFKGAMALARQLERFWHEKGYPGARFWIEPIDERFAKVGTYELYRVVCNLVNGFPPDYRTRRRHAPSASIQEPWLTFAGV